MRLSRRATLLGLTGAATLGRVRFALATANLQKRFIVVLQRGALDGMSAIIPYGDANLTSLRPALIPPAPGQPGGMFDLGGFYGLSPNLPNMAAMYGAADMLGIHAVAGPYRTRSHFEAQDLLQLGTENTGITSGWLNRVLAELPARNGASLLGLAAGIGTPLLLQGAQPVGSYAPDNFAAPSSDLAARISALYAADPLLAAAYGNGLAAAAFASQVLRDDAPQAAPNTQRGHDAFPALAAQVGQLLAAPTGPRIAVFQLEGWDTHGNQVAGLQAPMTGLDQGLQNLKTALGPAWAQSCVLVCTEFGRTAAMNGTRGTDHGTAAAAFVLGGAVAGGRVLATWPGLAPAQLFENRDLAPTLDIRAVAKGVLAAHLGLDAAALARVFPGSAHVTPLKGLIRVT